MNNERRKQIEEAQSLLDNAREILDLAANEEQDSFDNLPEGLQASERGERMEEIATQLADVVTILEDAFETLNDCTV
jgi:DNA repair ATPase RecN